VKVLLTGASGLIGRACARLVDERGHDVLATDLNPLPEGFADLPWRQLDVRQGAQVRRAFAAFAPDAVVHLAARHFIPWCERHPAATLHTNVLGTQNVLAAARAAGAAKFVFASSAAVYAPSPLPLAESAALGPDDIYGTSKVMGEQLVRLAAQGGLGGGVEGRGGGVEGRGGVQAGNGEAELDAVVLRLFNTIGPGDPNPHLVPRLLTELRAGGVRLRLGNLQSVRDYIHVDDVARAILAAIERELPGLNTVNVGSGRGHSVGDVVRVLGDLLGQELEVVSVPAQRRAVDRPLLVADSARARALLDWQPELSFAEGLARTLHAELVSA
jgi:UDP-glucose 4-epimerase